MVARMVDVLPAPGEAIRSSTKTPCSSSTRAVLGGEALVQVEDRLGEIDFHGSLLRGRRTDSSAAPARSSATVVLAVVGLDAVDLQLAPGQRLDVEAAALGADHLEAVVLVLDPAVAAPRACAGLW